MRVVVVLMSLIVGAGLSATAVAQTGPIPGAGAEATSPLSPSVAAAPTSPATVGSAPGPSPADAPATASSESALQDYQLGVADQVRMTTYNEPDLSGQFAVSATGVLSLPLIGDVPALGKTPRQVAMDVEHRLADGYLKDPRVTIEVMTYRPYYILGEVTKPGEYAYVNGLTVMNAVATAQGYTYRANKRRVFIKHAGSDTEDALKLTPQIKIRPGDTIRIGERYF